MKLPTKPCICCARHLPIATQFGMLDGVKSPVCIHCSGLGTVEAIIKTRDATLLECRIRYETKQGRKALRVERHQADYGTAGKRCSACHHYKPVNEYHACAPQSDGLQPNCIVCNKTRALLILQPGGRQSWIIYRDAMRATAVTPGAKVT